MVEQVLDATKCIKEFRADLSESLNEVQLNEYERQQGEVIATIGTLCDSVGNLQYRTNASIGTSMEYE